ncbi:23S rRNA (uracil(1939)-C(5))-methyltransferase RlmD [Kiloniella laminariae]|uniref:23S rRNA (Uracil(1939)-C(5))-methyltransferase RlmD n=1 Tax=Kiloniella laminariae TaxID=454162 RepID=A0ABT4LE23_9PROT|nr:23S rRNA (uracil(1939)-C(5))-methyltransferase RlmD [Kiloniella laminariae]MCZ4279344.1 23S rRNA (uracil(1939)-C(5))-methyltransferase RlmD [Kiloniella laminariae]
MRRKARPGGGKQLELVIDSLGARGDGVSEHEGRPVYVPGTMPGDRLRVKLVGERSGGFKAEILELLEAGESHVDAPCQHYGVCGGCNVQHVAPEFYRRWKRDIVVQALTRKGFSGGEVAEMVQVAAGTRRRAVFSALARGKKVSLGFHERESHRVVDVIDCKLLNSPLAGMIAPLRELLMVLLVPEQEKADITAISSTAGLDILVVSTAKLTLEGREAITAFAEKNSVARFAWNRPGEEPEPVAIRDKPIQVFGDIPVLPPEGAFLQPSAEGQQVLTDLVMGYLPDSFETVADLFSGCGTFTFPLSKRAQVHAVEGDERAVMALTTSARRNETTHRITSDCRDLDKDPITEEELEGGDCVVLDPPRTGAREQCYELAKSDIKTIVYVSCSPSTFARDARILVEGGYSLQEVTPVDQFIWSEHVELVARFEAEYDTDDDSADLDVEEES